MWGNNVRTQKHRSQNRFWSRMIYLGLCDPHWKSSNTSQMRLAILKRDPRSPERWIMALPLEFGLSDCLASSIWRKGCSNCFQTLVLRVWQLLLSIFWYTLLLEPKHRAVQELKPCMWSPSGGKLRASNNFQALQWSHLRSRPSSPSLTTQGSLGILSPSVSVTKKANVFLLIYFSLNHHFISSFLLSSSGLQFGTTNSLHFFLSWMSSTYSKWLLLSLFLISV